MNRNQLYESMEHIDDQILERSEKRKGVRKRFWMGAVAAVLVIAVAAGIALQPRVPIGGNSGATTGQATDQSVGKANTLRVAMYPEMAPYPDESQFMSGTQETFDSEGYSKEHDAWWESLQAQRRDTGYAQGLESFWEKTVPA